ncbi:methyltransferase family protein [Hyphobacterium marinum]|uniref:Isoprenylcysteine carboxylmethyltransferase family protein n=1 Tax=Hyphobacterium marinum TaxID=3116574 RepID=A0ABU7LXP6_9PROT|nr:isoprenylcysteine carboxylmethyltransferase family protein [Hyphobacterium sp. Y6023]MEE2566289.1 isoprenylcysteine carboxylmethyltransferase family protein [Hyphobacterium sp. Y6023]
MPSAKRFYDRIFGSGPAIAAAAALCLLAGWVTARLTPVLSLDLPLMLRATALASGTMLALGLIGWSVWTLRPEHRGTELVTRGPFRLVRHPLYAACLSLFGPGLIIALSHPAYAVALVLAYLAAHRLIGREEALMANWFPDSYPAYCTRTGRFWPRLGGVIFRET